MHARVVDGVVVEIIEITDGLAVSDLFHPDFAQDIHPCGPEVQQGWTFADGQFSAPVAAPVDLVAYAADARWRKEVGGIDVAGVPVATDDRSKMMIVGARVAAAADPGWSTVWHGADGNTYPVDAAAMIAISDAVQAHVNTSFGTFAAVKADIEAEVITNTAAVDAAFA
jgi:hypothetical protein